MQNIVNINICSMITYVINNITTIIIQFTMQKQIGIKYLINKSRNVVRSGSGWLFFFI